MSSIGKLPLRRQSLLKRGEKNFIFIEDGVKASREPQTRKM